MSKPGHARRRKPLFLPTRTAVRFNPALKRVFSRPVGAGRPKTQAVGARMWKLVVLCYGVLKPPPFDPKWTSRGTT